MLPTWRTSPLSSITAKRLLTSAEAMAAWMEDMERLHGKAEVIIGKQRHGPIGTVELSFEGRFTRFGNLVKAWQQDSEY